VRKNESAHSTWASPSSPLHCCSTVMMPSEHAEEAVSQTSAWRDTTRTCINNLSHDSQSTVTAVGQHGNYVTPIAHIDRRGWIRGWLAFVVSVCPGAECTHRTREGVGATS
jgi:hypothetical protein